MTKANDSEVRLDDDTENTVTKSSENNQENNMISKIILTCKDKNMLMDQYDLLKDKYKNNPKELEMVRKITASRLIEFLKDGSLKPEEYEKMLDDMSRREPDFAVILLHSLFHAIEMDKQGVAKQNEYNKAKYEHDKQHQSQQGGGRSGLFNFGGGSIKEPKLVEPNENLSKTIEQSHRIMSSLLSGSNVNQKSQNILNSLKEYSAFNNLHYMDFNHHLDTIKKYDEQKEQRENLDIRSKDTNLSDYARNQAMREKEKLLTPDDVERGYANAKISLSKIIENNNIKELNEESMDDFMKGLGMKEEGDGIIFHNNVKKVIEHEEKTGALLPQDNPSANFFSKLKSMFPSASNNPHYMDFNHHLDTIKKYDEQKEQRENLDIISSNTNLSDEDRNQAIREKEKLLTPDDVKRGYANAKIALSKIIENNNIEELNEESMDDFMKRLGMKEEGDGIIFHNNVKKVIEHEEKTGALLPQDNPFANFFSKLKSMFSPSSSANMQP